MNTVTADARVGTKVEKLRENLRSVIRGKDEIVEEVIVALVAGGSVLIEDVPGVGKTTLAKTLAASVELDFKRVQCTPDLLPADIFGFSVFNPQNGSFDFRRGPIFTNVLLVDEINRASPRTQSALLEAMAERQVTVEGAHHDLPPPFMVLATQNPLGFQGTFPLPESQLDRFLLQLSLNYPDAESEVEILYDQMSTHPVEEIAPVLSRREVLQCQAEARSVKVERCIAEYIVKLVQRTRQEPRLRLGSSPRGSLMLFRAAQAAAFVQQRDFVLPDDVQRMAPLVLTHRVVAARSAHAGTDVRRQIVEELIRQVDVPV
jgi:MoxR-like ATPase